MAATLPTATSVDLVHPWRDLRDRLNAAVAMLNDLRHKCHGTDEEIRLTWKRDAVANAYDAWERLNDQVIRNDIDHATAWHTFTNQVAYLLTVPMVNPGYHEGVSLALSYQDDTDPANTPHS